MTTDAQTVVRREGVTKSVKEPITRHNSIEKSQSHRICINEYNVCHKSPFNKEHLRKSFCQRSIRRSVHVD